ncbi:hypothetical protein HDV02_002969 [Globomyces sp. JEL0801]|nr:hypothetical protein HDV02_002969 [Globomyces sp. JEL0801]
MPGSNASKSSKEGRLHNAVHNDAIWRQTIRYEANTATNWEKNWGFMQKAMIENEAIARKEKPRAYQPPALPKIQSDNRRSGLPSKLAPGLADKENPIVSDWLFTSNTPRIIQYRFPSEKYNMPTTTSNDIGWPWFPKEGGTPNNSSIQFRRTGIPQSRTLETFGKHARGRGDVLKWFGARESLP